MSQNTYELGSTPSASTARLSGVRRCAACEQGSRFRACRHATSRRARRPKWVEWAGDNWMNYIAQRVQPSRFTIKEPSR
jgi:hypothetical protein